MTFAIPQRIGWAVGIVDARGPDSLLEVGCGRGAAVGLIAESLTSGRILAIDRSADAIAAARERNRKWEVSGKAAFLHSPLCDLKDDGKRFDKIFAINVNLFWTDPGPALAVVRNRLKDEGRLYLFYESPQAARRAEIAERVKAKLSGSGLVIRKTVMKEIEDSPQLCLIAGHG